MDAGGNYYELLDRGHEKRDIGFKVKRETEA